MPRILILAWLVFTCVAAGWPPLIIGQASAQQSRATNVSAAAATGAQNTAASVDSRTTALTPEMASGEEERERWQRVPEVMDALGLKEGSWVADVGAGDGFFTVRLARAVGPTGRVFAVDIDKKKLATLRKRLRKGNITNVDLIRGKPDNPKLPPNKLDAVLIVNAYHEMKSYQAMLQRIHEALKPDGRMAVLDYVRRSGAPPGHKEPRDVETRKHEIDPEFVDQDLRDASFQVVDRRNSFIRLETLEWLIVAQPSEKKR